MNEASGGKERELFERLVTLPESRWGDFLSRHCSDDPELRRRLERLLDAHRSLMSQSSIGVGVDARQLREAPEAIGPFRIRGTLGEGGMGIVYDAEQSEPIRRRVALKVIKPGMDSKQVLARFESERQTLAMLEHPGIARVLDAGNTAESLPTS